MMPVATRTCLAIIAFILFYSFGANAQNQTISGGEATKPITFSTTNCVYNWTNDNAAIGLAASGSGTGIPSFTAINKGKTPLIAHITATPKQAEFAYVANANSKAVSLIDVGTNSLIKTIPTNDVPWDVATSANGDYVYVSNQGSSTVSVIQTSTNTVIREIKTAWGASGLAIMPDGRSAYVAACNTSLITLVGIDGSSRDIAVGQNPYQLVLSPNGKLLYVANSTSNSISVINTETNTVINTIRLTDYIYDITISPDGSRLYYTSGNSQLVSVVSTVTNTVIAHITVGEGASCLTLNADGTRLYVVNTLSDNVSVINTATNAVIHTINNTLYPGNCGLSADGKTLFVTETLRNRLAIINTENYNIISKVNTGEAPNAVSYLSTSNCGNTPIKFQITVNPEPPAAILVNGNIGQLNTVYGTPSGSESFEVSGTNISNGIAVTPPAGFEVSLNNPTFAKSVTIGSTGSNVLPTRIYIRLSQATPAGDYSGQITCSAAGTPDVSLTVPLSTVAPAPLNITVRNASKLEGEDNPPLTAMYSGFVNGEDERVLTAPPMLFTDATASSAAGDYPITISGAAAANYTISYYPGTLTIKTALQALVIPNTFTPNNDGVNDSWHIKNLDTYSKSQVDIFNRNGVKVFSYTGTDVAWDGRFNGNDLPAGTYYYSIYLTQTHKHLSGFITLLR